MTMDYGLTPAEQAAQRATQRADDTRRRRTVRTYQGMTGTDPGDFGGTPNNTKGAPFIPSPQMTRSPIIPPVRTAPMTGPTIRRGTDVGVDWTPVWGGAREPNVPVDFSRAGGTTRPVPLPPPNIIPNPRFPNARPVPFPQLNIIPDPRFPNARPVPMPTLPSRIGPMTGPTIRRGTDIGVDTSPWWSGGAFEPNSTGIPWDFGPSPYYPMRQVVEGF